MSERPLKMLPEEYQPPEAAQNGFYYFEDRHSEAHDRKDAAAALERYSVNFTAACTTARRKRFIIVRRTAERKESTMESRVAVIGIVVENKDAVTELNELLHEYGEWIIGRMGIPYAKRGVNVISVAIDAPQDVISALSGKVGRLEGVSAKTAYSNVVSKDQDGSD